MKLEEKGRFMPPPQLPVFAQRVSEALAAQPEVHARTHWLLGDENVVDGADFYLGSDELGHLHLDGEAHVAQPQALRAALILQGFAQPFRWSTKFVTAAVEGEADVGHVMWLFSLQKKFLEGTPVPELLREIRSRQS